MTTQLVARRGVINRMPVEAIVNATTPFLMAGGAAEGRIHRAAGPELLQAVRALGGCQSGDAKITPGFNLRAKHVIHAVGPIWQDGTAGEAELLAACYRRCIELAHHHQARSLALPPISVGPYRFPLDPAAAIAVRSIREAVKTRTGIERVIFCCFNSEEEQAFARQIELTEHQ